MKDCAAKQNICLGIINDYNSFFNHLTKDCIKEESIYINWDCINDKYTVCDDIKNNWDNLKDCILNEDNGVTTVPMQHFEEIETISKYRKTTKQLKAVSTNANIAFITNFINEQLTKITHHRNQLKHYRSIINDVKDHFLDDISIDMDFSENLSIPVKFEPQSLQWFHQQVTMFTVAS